MKLTRPIALATILTLATIATAQDKPKDKDPELPLDKQISLIKSAQDSLVIVQYHLQYDKGEPPAASGFGEGHTDAIEDEIKLERPLEKPGLLLENNRILTPDLQVHPRFIKEISVRRMSSEGNAKPIAAKIAAYPKNQNAIILELAAPLEGAKPAAFDPKRPGPYSSLSMDQSDGRWVIALQSAGGGGVAFANNKALLSIPPGLLLDKDATPVAVSTGLDVPADGTWKTSPATWAALSANDLQALLSKVDAAASRSIVPVTLNFRDAKKSSARMTSFRARSEDDDENAAVQHALGVVTAPNTILILAELKPSTTARLERIRVNTDPPVDATFKATLADYGALVAESKFPFPADAVLPLSTEDLSADNNMLGALLPSADISLHGEQRISYLQPRRISGFSTGWRNNTFPELAGNTHPFLFDTSARLLAVPVSHREKTSTIERYGRSSELIVTPIKFLSAAMSNLKENADPNNVPLSEEQQNRLAWLGVEMQALTPELARANKLSDQTQDGETGGLVTYVYPDSPAAKAGIETGWVLLRILAKSEPKPIDVHIDPDRFADQPFPWDRLSEAPESVFDRIPTPWPSTETPLTRTLTDLGIGTHFSAIFAHDGKIESKDFTVTQGPPSYDSAPKFKSEPLGITVRNLTYEVRRYMQKKDDEPGVVISKIEMGSKASVAGLKPYEVITHVNDQEVKNVADFERLTKGQTDLRLAIKRMTAGRIVKVSVTPNAQSQPADQ